jgi:hypothetical protein
MIVALLLFIAVLLFIIAWSTAGLGPLRQYRYLFFRSLELGRLLIALILVLGAIYLTVTVLLASAAGTFPWGYAALTIIISAGCAFGYIDNLRLRWARFKFCERVLLHPGPVDEAQRASLLDEALRLGIVEKVEESSHHDNAPKGTIVVEMKHGRWYFVVRCIACNRPHIVSKAPSPHDEPKLRPLRQRVLCDCGTSAVYSTQCGDSNREQ